MVLAAACGPRNSDSSDNKTVTIGVAPGWADDVAVSYLWKHVLEKKGYEVSLKELELGPIFIGVSKNDLDLYLDVALPVTHAAYWKQYRDSVVDLGSWYDGMSLELAVPEYLNVDSIADLKDNAAMFDGTITGIEPGAGETGIVKDKVMQAYNLDDYTLKSSSTPAMLAALKKATDAKEPIVATLWHPHWAYSRFPIKDLSDPKGAFGKPDSLHIMASKDFAKSSHKVTEAMKQFKISDKKFATLLVAIEKDPDHPDAGVDAWAKDNQDFMDQMMN